MKTRTLLIDSSYLLQRSFHGAKDTYTQEFGNIGALYQFFTTTRKLVKDHMVNKVILLWDGEDGGIDRYNIDNDYKSNRKNKKWHKKIEMTDAEIKKENEKKESILKQRMRVQAYAEELFLRQIEIISIVNTMVWFLKDKMKEELQDENKYIQDLSLAQDLNNCIKNQSPLCYNISCPCDNTDPDSPSLPCKGYSKKKYADGQWICSNAPRTVVDNTGKKVKTLY
jgi:hypothetical protein